MRRVRLVLVLVGITVLGAGSTMSQSQPPQPPPSAPGVAVDPEVLQLREAAWRAWFAGDEAALRGMLPAEFIGIDMEDGPFTTRDATVADARAFHAGGGRLVRLDFPETRAQRYGDVVVLYGRYSVVLQSGQSGESGKPGGAERTVGGRLTEVFVRKDGHWLHTGWHLDTVATP